MAGQYSKETLKSWLQAGISDDISWLALPISNIRALDDLPLLRYCLNPSENFFGHFKSLQNQSIGIPVNRQVIIQHHIKKINTRQPLRLIGGGEPFKMHGLARRCRGRPWGPKILRRHQSSHPLQSHWVIMVFRRSLWNSRNCNC